MEAQEIDIVVGTQLVTKGYHFPNLTLVGVVDADLGLQGGDLRAAERSFQQIQQVAGRAGRGDKPQKIARVRSAICSRAPDLACACEPQQGVCEIRFDTQRSGIGNSAGREKPRVVSRKKESGEATGFGAAASVIESRTH